VALGILLQAFVLVVIVTHNALARPPRNPLLPVLALVPLIRLLSLAMPIPGAAPISAYALVGAPALIGVFLVARAIGVSRQEIGLGRPRRPVEVALSTLVGVPLGLLARGEVGLAPISVEGVHPLLFVVVALPFVVLLEELVFRGLLQRVATSPSRIITIVAPNVLYASMYFGSGSTTVVLFMGLTGVIFGILVRRQGSLWGAIGAHMILRVLVQI
jgi:membrane protease YdiL (CAAX protease family)